MKRIALALAASCVLASTPAYAQSDFWAGVTADVIGQTVADSSRGPYINLRCMTGRSVVSQRQSQRIQRRANDAMTSYLAQVRTGERVDVTGSYVGPIKGGVWRLNGASADPTVVSDPLARHLGGAPLAAPDQFIAGGNRNSAGAVWYVRGAAGEIIGHYRAFFGRERNRWGLSLLEVVEGAAEPEGLAPFCEYPGDIELFLANHDERGRPLPAAIQADDATPPPPKIEAEPPPQGQ